MVRIKRTARPIEFISSDEDAAAASVRPPVAAMVPPVPVIELSSSEEDEEVLVAPLQAGVEILGVSAVPVRPPVVPVRLAGARRRPGPAIVRDEPTLRRVYAHRPLSSHTGVALVRFPPLLGPCVDSHLFPEVNDPEHLDLDAACFMMLTLDFPDLFGCMARPANRKVKVRDLPEFSDWLHVISDPVVVRVFGGSDAEQRDGFRAELVDILRVRFGLTLTCSTDSSTLSRNQVNVPVASMSQALYSLGARVCRVSFFGMKWQISVAEALLDRFIARYRVEMGSSVPVQKNLFDYGARLPTDGILLLRFSDDQERIHRYTDGTVHEMCNEEGYGSVDFRVVLDQRIVRVKVYQELCHEILSVIQKQMLDQMPGSMGTMRRRLTQLQDLLDRWFRV